MNKYDKNNNKPNYSSRSSNNYRSQQARNRSSSGGYRGNSSSGSYNNSRGNGILADKKKVFIIAGCVSLAIILTLVTLFITSLGGSGSIFGGGNNNGGSRPPVAPAVDITDFSSDGVEARIRYYLPEEKFLEMFPVRFGTDGWKKHWAEQNYPGYWTKEMVESKSDNYYTYDNLIEAARYMATRIHRVQVRIGAEYSVRISVIDKETDKEFIIDPGDGFDADWNVDKPILDLKTDYGKFLTAEDDNDNRRELAGWLANNAHEVGEMNNIAEGQNEYWGLYYNEEVGKEGATDATYTQPDRPNEIFPGVKGVSYHGRGPKQLSYNFNYGLFSAVLYSDVNPLLQHPERLVEDGKLAWMSSLFFWLTPQPPKASCSDVMAGRWKPSEDEKNKYGYEPGFAMSIIIINGGVEAGQKEQYDQYGYPVNAVARRIMFYKQFANILGADINGEQLSVGNMKPWG